MDKPKHAAPRPNRASLGCSRDLLWPGARIPGRLRPRRSQQAFADEVEVGQGAGHNIYCPRSARRPSLTGASPGKALPLPITRSHQPPRRCTKDSSAMRWTSWLSWLAQTHPSLLTRSRSLGKFAEESRRRKMKRTRHFESHRVMDNDLWFRRLGVRAWFGSGSQNLKSTL